MFSTSSTSPSSLFQLYSSQLQLLRIFDGLCKGLPLAHHRLSTIERSALHTQGMYCVLFRSEAITRLIVRAKSFKFKTISLPTRKFFEKSYDVRLFCKVKNMVLLCKKWLQHLNGAYLTPFWKIQNRLWRDCNILEILKFCL